MAAHGVNGGSGDGIELTDLGGDDEEQEESGFFDDDRPLLQEEGGEEDAARRLRVRRGRQIQSYFVLRRLATFAVHRGAAWQAACVLSAASTLLSALRAGAMWVGLRVYLRRSYVAIPFAAQCLVDTTMLLLFTMAEPNTVPKRESAAAVEEAEQ